MWRIVVAAIALAACGDPAQSLPDAAVVRTARFTPILCTSGNAGDPTCPWNKIDLAEVAPDTNVQFVLRVADPNVTFVGLVSTTATSLGQLTLEIWCADCLMPRTYVLATEIRMGGTGLSVVSFELAATDQLSFVFDGVR